MLRQRRHPPPGACYRPPVALLDGLDDIDWSRLHHAYGAASDVPDLRRALVDPAAASPALRKAAAAHGHEVEPALRRFVVEYLSHLAMASPMSFPAATHCVAA